MDHVYVVRHEYEGPDGADKGKFIGVYASLEQANAAVKRARRLPGFAARPDGFSVSRYEVGKDHWTEGFVTVTWGGEPE
jgi:hypothetical protein